MSETRRVRAAWSFAGYALVAVLACLALARLAAWITGNRLLAEAGQRLERVEAGQPVWAWQLRRPHDLIARRAFGNATLERDDGALRVTSRDGTPFELGLPLAWSVDLRHWPVLQVQLQSSAAGTLGVIWQADDAPACLAPVAHALTPATRSLRIDLRALAWQGAGHDGCDKLGMARLLRLRLQVPAQASVRLEAAALLTTEPMPRPEDVTIDLPPGASAQQLEHAIAPARDWPMPLFHLPPDASAETMLALRDRLRARWPAALFAPTGATPSPQLPTPEASPKAWIACALYLLLLAWLVMRPVPGRLRPWVELAGCLLGPMWLLAGLHWGLRPTPLGLAAFGGGLAYAIAIERRHLPRLWRLPEAGRDWLWPLAPLPIAVGLMLLHGHALHAQSWTHVLAYLAWAWLQQWLMLVVLLRRFEQILRRPGWAILPVVLVFALLHTPNGVLMQLCFVGELWWAWCFLRSRSVLPVALAHAGCALLVEAGLAGGELLRSLEVSARFFL